MRAFLLCICVLAEPPNLLVKNNTDKVDEPYDVNEEEEDYRNNDTCCVLNVQASEKTVYCPNDVEPGNAENEFDDPRKIVNSLDSFFHNEPPKILF